MNIQLLKRKLVYIHLFDKSIKEIPPREWIKCKVVSVTANLFSAEICGEHTTFINDLHPATQDGTFHIHGGEDCKRWLLRFKAPVKSKLLGAV
jgi:hypothetical protein